MIRITERVDISHEWEDLERLELSGWGRVDSEASFGSGQAILIMIVRSFVKKFQLVTMVFVLVSAATGWAGTEGVETALSSNPVYRKDCAKCHGKTATGRHFGGPALVSEKTVKSSQEDLRSMIANGKGRMPKFQEKLTPAQIDELVQQIVAVNKK